MEWIGHAPLKLQNGVIPCPTMATGFVTRSLIATYSNLLIWKNNNITILEMK